MAIRIIEEIRVRLGLDKTGFSAGAQQAKSESYNLANELKSATSAAGLMQGAMQAAGVMGFAYMAKEAVGAVVELAKFGAQVERTERAFDELARQAGGSSDDILAAIKRAANGTVSEFDAMKAANRGLMLGLGANAEQWEQLAEVARFRGMAMGRSMTEALDDITMGIGRESKLILDNLGILIDLDEVMAQYGRTVGKTADQLSAAERKQAILTSVIQDGQAQIQAAGGIADDAAGDFERLAVASEELKGRLAELASGPIADVAEQLARLLTPGTTPLAEYQAALGRALGATSTLAYAESIAAYEARRMGAGLRDTGSAADAQAARLDHLRVVTADYLTWIAGVPGGFDTREIFDTGFIGETAVEAARDAEKAWGSFFDDQEREWDNLKSTIESALRPTSVTAEDMGMANLGQYVDKWDENARRLDAIAARGFAELEAHPDWSALLGVPANVLAAGEDALKAWAQRVAGDVRDLFRPDLLNVEAAADAVEQYIQNQKNKEISIGLIAEELKGRGLAGPEATKALEEMYSGLDVGSALNKGLSKDLSTPDVIGTFVIGLKGDVTANKDGLTTAGASIWAVVFAGITQAVKEQDPTLVQILAEQIAPRVATILAQSSTWGPT